MTPSSPSSRPFLSAMAGWFAGACVLGATGRVAALTPPLPQVMIMLCALTLILFGALHAGLRTWLAQVNLRGFVAFHLTRFVGVAFLLMHQRGLLTGEFAITAGWGDNITALGALAIVLFLRDPLSRPGLLLAWNLFGFLDILLVVITATRIGLHSPAELLPLLTFPMSLVPTFVVPLVIASHVLVFWRLARLRSRPA